MTPGLRYWKLQVFEAVCGPTAFAALKIPHRGTCKHDNFVKHTAETVDSMISIYLSIVEGYKAKMVLLDLMCAQNTSQTIFQQQL